MIKTKKWGRKALSLLLAVCLLAGTVPIIGLSVLTVSANEDERDVMSEIFSDMGNDGVNPSERKYMLPFRDGTQLMSLREPLVSTLQLNTGNGESDYANKSVTAVTRPLGAASTHIFGTNNNVEAFDLPVSQTAIGPSLPSSNITVDGTTYSLELLSVLSTYEGDFTGDGKKNQLAHIVGARTKGTGKNHRDMLLLCVSAPNAANLSVISVLYEGEPNGDGKRFLDEGQWISRTAIITADMNGDGIDEIIAAAPTNKISTASTGFAAADIASDGFARQRNIMVWGMSGTSGSNPWRNADNWNAPRAINSLMSMPDAAYIGAPGATVSLAAGDIDRDGREDVVLGFSSLKPWEGTKEQQEDKLIDIASRSFLGIYYGAETLSGISCDSNALTNALPIRGSYLGALGVTIADLDGNGQPSVLAAYKRISDPGHRIKNFKVEHKDLHSNYFSASTYEVMCLDWPDARGRNFAASLMHEGGLLNTGLMPWYHFQPDWRDDRNASLYPDGPDMDNDRLDAFWSCMPLLRTDPLAAAALQIAVVKDDYGRRAASNARNIVSSGSIVVNGVIISYVRSLSGNSYNFETRNEDNVFFTTDPKQWSNYDCLLTGGANLDSSHQWIARNVMDMPRSVFTIYGVDDKWLAPRDSGDSTKISFIDGVLNPDIQQKDEYYASEYRFCIPNRTVNTYSIRTGSVSMGSDGFLIKMETRPFNLIYLYFRDGGANDDWALPQVSFNDQTQHFFANSRYSTRTHGSDKITFTRYYDSGRNSSPGYSYGGTDITNTKVVYDNRVNAAMPFNSTIIAMPDTDNDSVHLEYNGEHSFFWSDPVIVAALAAPPHFDALPDDSFQNSTTTYGQSNTSAAGTSRSVTTTVGTYISTEVSAGIFGIGGSWANEQEVTRSMTESAEEMLEVTHSVSYSTVGGEDTVVMTTAAFDAYGYTIHYSDGRGGTLSAPFNVVVPRGGANALKVASINYEDYEGMRPYAQGGLPDLSGVFSHNIGYPASYMNDEGVIAGSATTAPDSILKSQRYASFPSNRGNQRLSMEITKETTQVAATSNSVTTKMGGGFGADGEFLDAIGIGASVSTGSIYGKEEEYGKITTSAVGVSFEGVVHGQNDGTNTDGQGFERANFNWWLLRYVYSNRYNAAQGTETLQEFPVITYIIPAQSITQPEGVIPSEVKVKPLNPFSDVITEVGRTTPSRKETASFTGEAVGVSRESRTELVGAPVGMTLDLGNVDHISSSSENPFFIIINSSVKSGSYPLRFKVGGVLSDVFYLNVLDYQDRAIPFLESQLPEYDLGSTRNDWRGNAPLDTQTVAIINTGRNQTSGNVRALYNHSGQTYFESTYFDWPASIPAQVIYPNSEIPDSALRFDVTPKTAGLEPGRYSTEVLVVDLDSAKDNEFGAAVYAEAFFTITPPTAPDAPDVYWQSGGEKFTSYTGQSPVTLSWDEPDDGGRPITGYEVAVMSYHDLYMDRIEPVWQPLSGGVLEHEFAYDFDRDDHEDKLYAYVGVRAVNEVGTGAATWYTWHNRSWTEPWEEPLDGAWLQVYDGNSQIFFRWEDKFNPDSTEGEWEIRVSDTEFNGDEGWTSEGIIKDRYHYHYTATGLKNGKTYHYELRRKGSDLHDGSLTWYHHTFGQVTPNGARFQALGAENITAQSFNGKAIIRADIPDGYYASINGGGLPGWSHFTGYQTFNGLENDVTHVISINIHPYDAATQEELFNSSTTVVAVTPSADIPNLPSAPQNPVLTFSDSANKAVLTWEPPADNGGGDITGYMVEFDDTLAYVPVNAAPSHSFDLDDTIGYVGFGIYAVNASGMGSRCYFDASTSFIKGDTHIILSEGYATAKSEQYRSFYQELHSNDSILENEDTEYRNWSIKDSPSEKITLNSAGGVVTINIAEGLEPGEYNFVIAANTDPNQYEYNKIIAVECSVKITITETPVVTTDELPSGRVGEVYNAMPLAADGGAVIFGLTNEPQGGDVSLMSIAASSDTSGAFVDGLTLLPDGNIMGIPTRAGTFNFDVKAANLSGSDTKTLSITINGEEGSQEITGITVNESDSSVMIELSRLLEDEETLIVAVYDSETHGRLLSLKTNTAVTTTPSGNSYDVKIPISENAKSIKVICWGGTNTMVPLCNPEAVKKDSAGAWSEFPAK